MPSRGSSRDLHPQPPRSAHRTPASPPFQRGVLQTPAGRAPCNTDPSPFPGLGQAAWLIIQREKRGIYFLGQSEKFSLNFAETSLWGQGGSSGRRLGVGERLWRLLGSQTPDLPLRHPRPAQCERGMWGWECEITHGPLPKTPAQPRRGRLSPHAPHNCPHQPRADSPGSWGAARGPTSSGPGSGVGVEWGKRFQRHAAAGFVILFL